MSVKRNFAGTASAMLTACDTMMITAGRHQEALAGADEAITEDAITAIRSRIADANKNILGKDRLKNQRAATDSINWSRDAQRPDSGAFPARTQVYLA